MNEIEQRRKRIARIERELETYRIAIEKIEATMRKREWERDHLQAEIEAILQEQEAIDYDLIYDGGYET